jgi:hypothetical protein
MIDAEWRGDPHDPTAPSGRVHANISGATTEMKLPLAAETCTVSASSTGFPASQVIARNFRRLAPDAAALPGRIDHNVRIVLGRREEGATISGAISVNGERRVPEGLKIAVNGSYGEQRIDRPNATYSVSEQIPRPTVELTVESDETPVRTFTASAPDAEGHRHVDLVLESTGALHVHAIDGTTGQPAAGVALTLDVNVVSERSLSATVIHPRTVRTKTDDHGDCVFRGFTHDGKLTLRETKSEKSADAPLLAIDLAPDSPAEFHETVRVNATKATVWGIVPAPPGSGPGLSGSYRVVRARAAASSAATEPIPMTANGEGRWSFECAAPSEWLVWLTQEKTRVSEVAHVVADRAQSYGPVALALTTTHDVQLHMIHMPEALAISVYIHDDAGGPPQSESFNVTAPERGAHELERVIHMRGPARVSMQCMPDASDSRTQTHRVLQIDPQQSPVITVDWHNDQSRAIELTINGSAPKDDCVISLMSLDDEAAVNYDGTVFSVVQGKSRRAMPLVSGSYLYVILSDHDLGALYGIARIADSAAPAKIDWSGKQLARNTLGKGIELATLEGVSCAKMRENLRQITWPKTWGPEVTALFVPEHCEYTVMK